MYITSSLWLHNANWLLIDTSVQVIPAEMDEMADISTDEF